MQRPKSLALLFLIGAMLTGGALGFTADRVLVGDGLCARTGSRQGTRDRFAKDLGLSGEQRAAVEMVLDERHRQLGAIMDPVRPQLEAAKDSSRQQIRRLLTPEQLLKFDSMQREMMSQRHSKTSR